MTEQTVTVEPGNFHMIRWRVLRPTVASLAVESPDGPVWVLGLNAEGYDGYKRGLITPPKDPPLLHPTLPPIQFPPTLLGTPGPPRPPAVGPLEFPLPDLRDPPKGVLFSSPPTHAFSTRVHQAGIVGYWYLLLGNRNKAPVTVRYEAWE